MAWLWSHWCTCLLFICFLLVVSMLGFNKQQLIIDFKFLLILLRREKIIVDVAFCSHATRTLGIVAEMMWMCIVNQTYYVYVINFFPNVLLEILMFLFCFCQAQIIYMFFSTFQFSTAHFEKKIFMQAGVIGWFRVEPSHKKMLVEALQNQREVVWLLPR